MSLVRLALAAALIIAVIAATLAVGDPLVAWATAQQRALQTSLASALSAVRQGEHAATATMTGVCAAYGVIHAIGPGHGKLLISGAAVASRRTAARMAGLGLLASLTQGLTAIVLVYGGLGLFSITSHTLIQLSETWLTAASYGAIALVGVWLLWRGVRLAMRIGRDAAWGAEHGQGEEAAGVHLSHDAGHAHHGRAHPGHAHHGHAHPGHAHGCSHGGACDAGCKHLPAAEEVDRLESWKDALALILSIGMRPCSGALIVLALSWRYDLYAVGAASAVVMALGTGSVVAAIALLAATLRDIGPVREPGPIGLWSLATTQVLVGSLVVAIGVTAALAALGQPDRAHPLSASRASMASQPLQVN